MPFSPRDAELAELRARVAELTARLAAVERSFASVRTGCPIANRLAPME